MLPTPLVLLPVNNDDDDDDEEEEREGINAEVNEEDGEVEAWSRKDVAQLGQRVTVTAVAQGLPARRLTPEPERVGVVTTTSLPPLPLPIPVSGRGREG